MTEYENGILHSMVNNADAFIEAQLKLTKDHFSGLYTSEIFDVLLRLASESAPLDEPIIKARLSKEGAKYYNDNVKWQSLDTNNHKYYIDRLIDRRKRISLSGIGPLSSRLIREEKSTHDIISELEQYLLDIASDSIGNNIVSIGEFLEEFIENIKAEKKIGVRTTIKDLDAITNGFSGGQLIVVAGRPGMGKSAFALQIASSNAFAGTPFAIFSLEMSKSEIAERMIASISGVESWKLRTGKLSDIDWTKFEEFKKRIKETPFYIDDTGLVTIATLRAKAKSLKLRHKDLGGIVVDYLQLMASEKDANRVEEVSEISRGLKVLARELGIPIIAVSQLSRAVEQRENKRPILSDLRESGSIEQDADMVIFLYSSDYYSGENNQESLTEVILSKQRNGPQGVVKSIFKKQYQKFSSISP